MVEGLNAMGREEWEAVSVWVAKYYVFILLKKESK